MTGLSRPGGALAGRALGAVIGSDCWQAGGPADDGRREWQELPTRATIALTPSDQFGSGPHVHLHTAEAGECRAG